MPTASHPVSDTALDPQALVFSLFELLQMANTEGALWTAPLTNLT